MNRALHFLTFAAERLAVPLKIIGVGIGVLCWAAGALYLGAAMKSPWILAYFGASVLGGVFALLWPQFVEHEQEVAEKVAGKLAGEAEDKKDHVDSATQGKIDYAAAIAEMKAHVRADQAKTAAQTKPARNPFSHGVAAPPPIPKTSYPFPPFE